MSIWPAASGSCRTGIAEAGSSVRVMGWHSSFAHLAVMLAEARAFQVSRNDCCEGATPVIPAQLSAATAPTLGAVAAGASFTVGAVLGTSVSAGGEIPVFGGAGSLAGVASGLLSGGGALCGELRVGGFQGTMGSAIMVGPEGSGLAGAGSGAVLGLCFGCSMHSSCAPAARGCNPGLVAARTSGRG